MTKRYLPDLTNVSVAGKSDGMVLYTLLKDDDRPEVIRNQSFMKVLGRCFRIQTGQIRLLRLRVPAWVRLSALAALCLGSAYSQDGLTIPSYRPRIWFNGPNGSRLAQAKTWFSTHPFTPSTMEDYALNYLLSGNAADCTGTNGAIAQAKAFTIPFSTLKSAGDDPLRYSGEQVALVYDWCYSQMAPADAQLLRDRWAGATAGPTDPIHAPTDLGSVAGTSVLTSSSSPFLPNMAGNDVVIISSGGANCKAGMYGILTYTDANTITLDADPTNGGNASGCIGRISGYVDGARPGAWNGQWNGTVGPGSNYNWGFFRNEVLWGVTLAGDSTYSTPFLDASLGTQPNSRWNVFLSYANGTASYAYPTTNASGGILTEGSQYGQYSWGYQAAPNVTSGLLGRDLFNESNWFIDAVYYIIYSTTVGPTLNNATSSYFQFFTMSDTDVNATSNGDYPGVNIAPIVPNGGEYASTMLAVANEYSTMNVGKLARQWLNTVNPGLLRYQAATDPGGAGLAFSNLPLDYYSDGLGMLISKNSWSASATQMRTISSVAASSGHGHRNSGDFAMLRNGAWLTRESASYSTNIVGPYGQTHAVSESVAHNTIALGPSTATTCNIGQGPGNGYGQTVRLESQPLYSYQVIDLSSVYRSTSSQPCRDDNPYAGTVQREFLFIRSMETLVIFDRVLAVDSPLSGDTHPVIAPASVVKTVYVHSIVNP